MSRTQSFKTLMTTSLLECGEESQIGKDLRWKWCQKKYIMVLTAQNKLRDERGSQLCLCGGFWVLFSILVVVFFFCFVLGRVACFFVSFLGDRFLCISFTEKSILKYIKNKYRKRMQKGPAGKVQEKESKEVLG